ncbi:hypothetical protein MYCTH_2301829 [Thermothelomyces thermophilus ATCC 42464]|uniref:Uncharacterized protein n=1 Tax=Thermothelomyces thermophilus (strain ATCC 42464 / BCRC 31852 / DSM 1799) TaxID=573729 RepID=G2QAB8_THET4|nr:uncharacterized protein MYCTH_2301829 [Thermothelomyces thermophilus ATCC 42464]AEO56668.1 hypothetical protein MYCTH_2301829 [Thermothelomyces thermophilus ATCC 42464]
MCGPETPSATPRVGARVDLSSPTGRGSLGNLLFLNPSSPSSTHATHVRFHQRKEEPSPLGDRGDCDDVLVSIHMTGDLTKPLAESGLMRQFTLRGHSEGAEMPLGAAVSLQVGQDGIIGRRVSVRRGHELLADGIVGFNFVPVMAPSGV